MFLDTNQESIYVGQTRNLTGRIRGTHFADSGHLPEECYNETATVVYSRCLSESDMVMQERYLINALKPKYNDRLNRGDTFSFTIDCFDWKYLPFVRPEERPKKRSSRTGLLALDVPNVSVQVRPMAVPSLAAIGTLSATRDNPGEFYKLYSFGTEFEPLRGLRMNDELWLSALSICEFCFASDSGGNSSKIRIIQFIKNGFLTCDDVCIVEDGAFCRSDYRASHFGKLWQEYPQEEIGHRSSNGILIRARALKGIVGGLLERHTRGEKKRLDRGASIKAFYWVPVGDFPTKRCKTFDEYCEFMAGPNRANANLFSVAYRIPAVCEALSCIKQTGATQQ